jgi:Nuclease-related domain
MSDVLLQYDSGVYLIPLVLLVVLLTLWLWYRQRAGKVRTLQGTMKQIGFERIENLVVPNGDEGEIQIDHVLLTANGVLIVHVKDVIGTVFGSDKMQDWTVISADRRFTFSNPQPALYDRIAAIRQIIREVPVSGRILFLDDAEFSKGVPSLVCTMDDLLDEFGEPDRTSAKVKIEAFRPHWEKLLRYTRR